MCKNWYNIIWIIDDCIMVNTINGWWLRDCFCFITVRIGRHQPSVILNILLFNFTYGCVVHIIGFRTVTVLSISQTLGCYSWFEIDHCFISLFPRHCRMFRLTFFVMNYCHYCYNHPSDRSFLKAHLYWFDISVCYLDWLRSLWIFRIPWYTSEYTRLISSTRTRTLTSYIICLIKLIYESSEFSDSSEYILLISS